MKDWQYEPAPDLEQPLGDRLRNFPRQPDMSIYTLRTLSALALRVVLRLGFRFTIQGREALPLEGSFVMLANHSSHLDAPCLLSALPLARLHRAFPAAAADYFFSSVPRSFFAAVAVNALPFDRQGGGEHSLELCRALLSTPGHVLILFPEAPAARTGRSVASGLASVGWSPDSTFRWCPATWTVHRGRSPRERRSPARDG